MTPELIAEASAWIGMLTNEGCTDATRAGFASWITESAVHAHAFAEAMRIWEDAGKAQQSLQFPTGASR